MDINVLIVGEVFSIAFFLLQFLGRKAGWSLLGLIGVILAGVVCGALFIDGNITSTSGSTTTTLASANNQVLSDFGIFWVMTIGWTFGGFVITVRKLFRI